MRRTEVRLLLFMKVNFINKTVLAVLLALISFQIYSYFRNGKVLPGLNLGKDNFNMSNGSDLQIQLNDKVVCNLTRKFNSWSIHISFPDEKFLHVYGDNECSDTWSIVDDMKSRDLIVDCDIDGKPDWRGKTKENREIFRNWQFDKISEFDADKNLWKSGQEKYSYDIQTRKFTLLNDK